jgi:arylsulfatase A-like enzyme
MRAVEYAEKTLAKSHGKPFFLAVGLWHPHIPLFAPQRFFDMYRDPRLPEVPSNDLEDVPEIGRRFAAVRRAEHERIVKEGKWKEAVQAYLAAISFADEMVGQVLGALERSRHARNTIVVFWSDNGWHLGEKEHWHKSTLWERSTHVPLIFAGPGVKAAGRARRQAVSLLDLYPTLVEMCGLPERTELEGLSLAPLLDDPSATRPPAVTTHMPDNHSVRTERWRYIRYRDGSEELYDRAADPNEFRNLAGEAKYADLKRDLARWMPAKSAAPKPNRTDYDFDFESHTYRLKGRE